MSWIATAVIGGSVVSAAVGAYGANTAASAPEQAAATAANAQLSMYNQTNANLAPFRNIGNQAATQLGNQLTSLTTPVSVNQNDFVNSPAYQFLQSTGMKGVTNSAAARGLASSGAALKGAAAFESGLNSHFYQQDFNNQVPNQTNAFNRLSSLVNEGENAAAATGAAGTSAANGISSAATNAGNAAAAGANGVASAVSGGVNSGTTNLALLSKGLFGNNALSSGSTGVTGNW